MSQHVSVLKGMVGVGRAKGMGLSPPPRGEMVEDAQENARDTNLVNLRFQEAKRCISLLFPPNSNLQVCGKFGSFLVHLPSTLTICKVERVCTPRDGDLGLDRKICGFWGRYFSI